MKPIAGGLGLVASCCIGVTLLLGAGVAAGSAYAIVAGSLVGVGIAVGLAVLLVRRLSRRRCPETNRSRPDGDEALGRVRVR